LSLIRAKYFLIEVLSGLIIPLNFFPEPLAGVSAGLPFQHISFTPLMIYMGKIQNAALGLVLIEELAWSIALLFIGHWFWLRATHKLIVQGG
jgi:ABC-2 type transport system permease protein